MKLIPVPYRMAAGVFALVVAVVLAIYLVNRNSTPDFNQVPLPTGGGTLSNSDAQIVRSLAMRLHDDMAGIAIPGFRDTDAYSEFLQLTDVMFVAVYNDFGKLYFSEGDGTLREWIDNENFSYTFSILTPWSIYQGNEVKDEIFIRMNALNLQ